MRPPGDDLLAMRDEMLDQLLQPHRARLAIHQRDVDHRHRDLARRVLIKLVDHHLRIGIALQIDHDSHRVLAARFIVDGRHFLELLLLHPVGDRFEDRLADDAVGNLVDDDEGLAALVALRRGFWPAG